MSRALVVAALAIALGAALVARTVSAQNPAPPPMPSHQGAMPSGHGAMPHSPSMHQASPMGTAPTLPGQDAFGAIAEVVRLLDADPSTDWSKVDLERLRQHLIDMNEVVLKSDVKPTPIAGGLVMEVTGTGRTEHAIRAMVVPHAAELDRMAEWSAKAEPIAGGVRLTVTAKKADDVRAVARLRGLGFIGLLTLGAHHGPHHLAMARGESPGHAH